jgi:ferredoxin
MPLVGPSAPVPDSHGGPVKVVVHVDPTLCRGHGICALFFSDGVELDHWGFGRPVDDPVQGRRALARARRAARACPNGAISYDLEGAPAGDNLQPR